MNGDSLQYKYNTLKYSDLNCLLLFFFLLFHLVLFAQVDEQQVQNQKIEDYKQEIKQKWVSDIDSALIISDKAIVYCNSIRNIPEKTTFIKMKGIGYYYSGQFDKADSIFHLGLHTSEQNNYKKLTGDYYNLLMIVKRKKNVYDSAVYYGNKNIAIRKEMKDSFNLAGAYDNLANVYKNLGDFNKAIELNTKSIDIFKQNNNLKDLGLAYENLSNLYGEVQDYTKSLEYLIKGKEIFEKINDEYNLANIDYNFGFYYYKQKKYPKSLEYFRQSYKLFSKLNKTDALGDVDMSIGEIYIDKNQFEKAYPYLKNAEYLYHKAGIPDYKAEAESKLALLFLKQKKKDSTLKYLHKAQALTQSQSILFKKKLLQTEMDYYNTFGDFKNAYQKSLELSKINDSIHTLNIQEAIHKKLLEFKLDKMKSENTLLKQKQTIDKLHNKQMKLTSFALSALTVLSFVILYLFLKKRKREKEISGLRIKEAELKKQEMEAGLHANERQLAGFTLHMMQKNLILKDLLEYVKQAEKSKEIDISSNIKEFKIKLINALSSDQDWKTFEVYFEKANPKFLNRLKEKHPDLTAKEIKLATMVRLNMDIKEAASTMNVAPNSIRIARYRLRKKLGLTPEDNLYEYMLGV